MVFRIVTPWHKHSISSEFKTSPLCYVISNQINSKLPVYIYECGPSVLFLLSNSCFWVIYYFQWIQPMTSLASVLLPHKWYVFTKGRKQIFILVISKGILFIPARWSWPHELWIQSWPPSLPTVWVFPSWRFFLFQPCSPLSPAHCSNCPLLLPSGVPVSSPSYPKSGAPLLPQPSASLSPVLYYLLGTIMNIHCPSLALPWYISLASQPRQKERVEKQSTSMLFSR